MEIVTMDSMDDLRNVLKEIGVGIRPIDDPYFQSTYKACRMVRRTGITVQEEEEFCHNFIEEFQCNIVGCKQQFKTLLDYEIHYNGSHRYVCQNCKKSLPTPRILDIHIQESHDTFFQVSAEKQPMYQCYVSECDLKFMNTEERRLHCISIHKFPKKFRYEELIKNKHKEKTESMETDHVEADCNANKATKLGYKQQKTFAKFKSNKDQNVKNMVESNTNVQSSSDNVSIKSSLMFLPRQVQQKSFAKVLTKSEQNTEQNVLESRSIMDIAEALPDIDVT